jgi:predicted metal-binding protein
MHEICSKVDMLVSITSSVGCSGCSGRRVVFEKEGHGRDDLD